MVSEAGGKAVRVGEKGGLAILPEASRPQGLFSPPVPGGLEAEAGSKALLPRAWVRVGSLPDSADGGKTGDMHLFEHFHDACMSRLFF